MRVDAAEFVPATVRKSSGLSASSPEFVPGAAPFNVDATWWGQQAVAPAEDGSAGAGEGNPDETYAHGDGAYLNPGAHAGDFSSEAGLVSALLSDQDSYVDLDYFLTPQILPAPEQQENTVAGASSSSADPAADPTLAGQNDAAKPVEDFAVEAAGGALPPAEQASTCATTAEATSVESAAEPAADQATPVQPAEPTADQAAAPQAEPEEPALDAAATQGASVEALVEPATETPATHAAPAESAMEPAAEPAGTQATPVEAASEQAATQAAHEESVGSLRVEGRRLHWEVPGVWDELRERFPRGDCLKSPPFSVAGVSPCRLALFPSGAALTARGDCAVSLLCEEKAKLKFVLYLNARSSGMKVMLGKSFACDFRQPDLAKNPDVVDVSVEVHENLFYAGFR